MLEEEEEEANASAVEEAWLVEWRVGGWCLMMLQEAKGSEEGRGSVLQEVWPACMHCNMYIIYKHNIRLYKSSIVSIWHHHHQHHHHHYLFLAFKFTAFLAFDAKNGILGLTGPSSCLVGTSTVLTWNLLASTSCSWATSAGLHAPTSSSFYFTPIHPFAACFPLLWSSIIHSCRPVCNDMGRKDSHKSQIEEETNPIIDVEKVIAIHDSSRRALPLCYARNGPEAIYQGTWDEHKVKLLVDSLCVYVTATSSSSF